MALIISCNAWVLFFVLMTPFSDALKDTCHASLVKRLEQDEKALHAMEAALAAQGEDIAAMKDKTTAASNGVAVAFTARYSTDDINAGLRIGDGQILRFDDVVANSGNGYDVVTGIFTAPISGVYAFFLNVMGVGQNGHLAIKVNEHILAYVYSKASLDETDQGSTMVTKYLTAGDRVYVTQHTLNAVRGKSYTVFTGFLIN